MKRFEVEVTPAAAMDLEDIWLFIAQHDPYAAGRVLHALEQRINSLATMPHRAQLRTDIRPTARSMIVGRYLVLYEVTAEKVQIVRVVHGATNLSDLKL